MKIKNAENVQGFLLYSPFDHKYFFRVYHEDKSFTDYKLCADDIQVQILGRFLELCETEDGDEETNKLDYSRKVLGRDERRTTKVSDVRTEEDSD